MSLTRDAAQNGYDSINMRELAEAGKMSMTTIYQFCSSKDHLIAEAHVEEMESLRAQLRDKPPAGATAQERVLRVVRGMARNYARNEALMKTMFRAVYSLDPAVHDVREQVQANFLTIMNTAIGDEDVDNRVEVIETLAHVLNSLTFGWVSGRHDIDYVRDHLEMAVKALLKGH